MLCLARMGSFDRSKNLGNSSVYLRANAHLRAKDSATRHESKELEPLVRLNHGDTEDTENIDLLGESTGKTLSDLRDSVFPLLKPALGVPKGFLRQWGCHAETLRRREFDTGFSYSPRPLRSRRFYSFSPGAVLGNAEIAEDAEAPQGERTFAG